MTITGTNLRRASAVKFGATNASGVTVVSATQITATAPAAALAGTVDVTVTTPGGTSATTAADQYTYTNGPSVAAISPTSGPTAGGTSVTITGANLDERDGGQVREQHRNDQQQHRGADRRRRAGGLGRNSGRDRHDGGRHQRGQPGRPVHVRRDPRP